MLFEPRRNYHIPRELLRSVLEPGSISVHQLFLEVWASGRVPAERKDGMRVALYKGKGSRTECGNYRLISLLLVPGKVFAHVLLGRMQLLLDRHHHPQPTSFTVGPSTMDTVLILRLLAELH